jgi:DHA2 family multidrug resistance protein-like MFS transporter
VDVTGVLISSAGLAALTYGLIRAGQDGWSDPAAVAAMLTGAVALAGFAGWQRLISRAGTGQPLVDLTLFRSAGFTWGTLLSTMVQFALFGIVFAMPQYFLSVRGVDSLGAGVRLLPMIGGLAAGLIAGQRLQSPRRSSSGGPAGPPLVNAKILVAGGFAIMTAALAVGASTTLGSSTAFTATWIAATGLGLGFAMPTALNAALGALSPERSGSGSALMTALRQVGGTIGVAVLGTILASAYQSHLHLPGIPAALTHPARSSVAAGVGVAGSMHSAPALRAVRSAYVDGLDIMLWTCGGIALAAALLAALFLPGGPAAVAATRDGAAPASDLDEAPRDEPDAATVPGTPPRAE